MPSIEIPWQQLSADALQGLMQEFITRDGTDYGVEELTLEAKTQRLQKQIEKKEVLILFDDETESCQLINRREYEQQSSPD